MSGFAKSIRREDFLDANGKKKRWKEMDSRCNKKPRFLDPSGKRQGNDTGSVLRSEEKQTERKEPEKVSLKTNLS